ncbi:hypothetical protein EYC80_002967 [Monilinia laxa]|uniref:SWIM-type domain-containing protein n=1 Tax=Monilinia laxa TaxID=61186 RepID=A0A5N6KCE9_MONLA|nr:hypothetical protein EYC80_002967 [Monilinia laxa]
MAQSNTSSSPSSPTDQALETTTVSGSYSSTTSADMDTQLGPLLESRKRSRDTDSEDSIPEEREIRRARTGGYSSHQHERRNGTSTSAVRRPMKAMRGRQFSFPVGRRTTYREQERISNSFVNTGISAAPTPVISLTDVDREATPSSPERTSRKRVHEEESDISDSIKNGHSAKVRHRGRPKASTRNPTLRSRARAAGVSRRFPDHKTRNRLPPQTQNDVERGALMTPDAAKNHDSKAESILAPSELSAAEAELERGHHLFHQHDGILPPRTPSSRYSSPDFDQLNSPQMPDREVFRHQSLSRTILNSPSSSEASSGEELPALLGEQRSRPFLSEPTPHFKMLLHEVETQIMYLCARERWDDDGREDRFLVIGTTGNLYCVHIGKNPSCTCFQALGRNLCKHIVFVLVKVLMLEAPLRYQVAFLSSEVESMLDVVIIDDYCEQKPADNCPICLEKIDEDGDDITWCKSKCGISYHQSCQLRWATINWAEKQRVEDPTIVIKCGCCRAPWIYTMAELKLVIMMYDPENANQNGDYYNVSKILGMKGPGLSETEKEDYQRFVQEAGGLIPRPRPRIDPPR